MTPVDSPPDDEFGQRLRRALRALPDAPPALQRAAIGLWPAPAPRLKTAAQALLQQIGAALRFDSWAAAPALAHGMRSLRSPTRHLLYSAQGRDIDLRIAPLGADAFSLAGQILGPDEAGSVVLHPLDGDDRAARSAMLDALGEFRIDGVPRGSYRLTLQVSGDEIVVAPIEFGEPPN